jgi:hypothetical protein
MLVLPRQRRSQERRGEPLTCPAGPEILRTPGHPGLRTPSHMRHQDHYDSADLPSVQEQGPSRLKSFAGTSSSNATTSCNSGFRFIGYNR